MPSLNELVGAHAPLLILDAASSQVQVGIVRSREHADWQSSAAEAGVALFRCVEKLAVDIGDIRAFAFCEGPGSVLGVRTAAMMLRTWSVLKPRPLFGYCSLALVAHGAGDPDVTVIADARRDSWHRYQIATGLARVMAIDLRGKLVMPENFRNWSALPAGVGRVPYVVADLLRRVADADVFHPTDAPDAFLHEEPNYVTWTPKIHRAPGER
jgi:tRNA threonylcarbamoyladenosine biosynthesis protein TsaB